MDLRNTINFLFTSNHPNAFHLDVNDRRFFVWECVGERMPDAFFAEFVEWRDGEGGLQALMHYFMTVDLTGFNPKAHALITDAKQAMIEVGRSDVERWLFEHYIDPGTEVKSEIVYVDDLVAEYENRGRRSTNTTAVGTALTRMGVRVVRRVKIDGVRKTVRAIRRPDYWAGALDAAWVAEYQRGFERSWSVSQPATLPQSGQSLH